jgi:hypothetical protein|tara:strand:- start:741 stop:881 length:141 start_codon:yes stop_codon:yes gene_type:complete
MSTTIKVEDETLIKLRHKRIGYQAKHKIICKNDDEFLNILLEKTKL